MTCYLRRRVGGESDKSNLDLMRIVAIGKSHVTLSILQGVTMPTTVSILFPKPRVTNNDRGYSHEL